jgi:hypothetical protein
MPEEMHPLNDAWLDFDLDAVTTEELERRFELALAPFLAPAVTCSCPALTSCGTFCVKKPPV